MMMLLNAKERDEREWGELVGRAGEGLVEEVFKDTEVKGQGKRLGIVKIQSPQGCMHSLIEVGFMDDGDAAGVEVEANGHV